MSSRASVNIGGVLVAVGMAAAALAGASAVLQRAAAVGAVVGHDLNQTSESPCTVTHTKTASPDVLLLGETVGVTLTVKATCAGEGMPLHIVLVLDGSDSMAGLKRLQMEQTASLLIRGLDMPSYPATKVGVVEFNSQARRLCSLTNNENQAVGCVNRVGLENGTRIDLGIVEGLRVLRHGRSGLNADELSEVMVVLSDGGNDAGCGPVLSAGRQVKSQGILLVAVCVGSDCDEPCMRQLASSPRYYVRAENAAPLHSVFKQIRDRIIGIGLRKLTVRDSLPDWMEYVPDSAEPRQTAPDAPDRWLEWEETFVPADGVTYSFEVKPLKTGYMPTNIEAAGELIDNRERARSWVFERPWVTVLGPEPLVTAATPAPAATPTATATTEPSPTATPAEQSLHLPRVLRLD